MQRERRGEQRGRREGLRDSLRDGRADGLLEGIAAVCRVLQIELDDSRRNQIAHLDASGLSSLLSELAARRQWPLPTRGDVHGPRRRCACIESPVHRAPGPGSWPERNMQIGARTPWLVNEIVKGIPGWSSECTG
jgi:hypothetical protein